VRYTSRNQCFLLALRFRIVSTIRMDCFAIHSVSNVLNIELLQCRTLDRFVWPAQGALCLQVFQWDKPPVSWDEAHPTPLTIAILPCFVHPGREYDSKTSGRILRFVGESTMARKLLAFMVVLAAVSLPCAAKMRTLTSPEDRERVVDYARSLEEHPLAKDNLAKRMWLTEWIVKAPDVTVDVCCKELQSLDEVNNTYSEQLRMQAMYSQAAFELEHPDVTNSATIQAAGLAGTLRAYRAILRFDPSAKYPVLDNLLSLEKQGKLQKYVERRSKCMEE